MKMIRMVVSDILMFLGMVVAYMVVIAGRIAGLEAFNEDALKKEIACPSCGMDMRIHAKYNADTIAKLEALVEAIKEAPRTKNRSNVACLVYTTQIDDALTGLEDGE